MPKIVDHEQVRADIVSRAVALFAEQGFGGLGIRGLARAVGMAKSSIYYYFPTKDALIEAVIAAVVAQDMASLEEAVADAGDLADKLRGAVAWASSNEEGLATQIRILNEAAREGIWVDDGSVTRGYVKGMGKLLGLSAAETRGFYFHLTGVVLQRMIDGGRTSLRRELGQYADLVLGSHGITGADIARTAPKVKTSRSRTTRSKTAAKTGSAGAGRRAGGKKTASKRASGKKTASKKAGTRKAAGKKAASAKKAATKKAATKKAATKKAATKKAATKKAASKRSSARKGTRAKAAGKKKTSSAKAAGSKTSSRKAGKKKTSARRGRR